MKSFAPHNSFERVNFVGLFDFFDCLDRIRSLKKKVKRRKENGKGRD